jgi:hypothetical protein
MSAEEPYPPAVEGFMLRWVDLEGYTTIQYLAWQKDVSGKNVRASGQSHTREREVPRYPGLIKPT